MATIYHILGANIAQHNQTLLQFFATDLLPDLQGTHNFYVVGDRNIAKSLNSLAVRFFPHKRAIAQAVVKIAKQDPNAYFVLHGQFNFWIWFAIFCGNLTACRCAWHIWGADLYQDSTAWHYRLIYPWRRRVQQRLSRLWGTVGDLNYAQQHLQRSGEQDNVLYFPTKLVQSVKRITTSTDHLTILVGNSGDKSNRHLSALVAIQRQFGSNVKIIIPMGYPDGNQLYIAQVEKVAKQLFSPQSVQILRQRLAFEQYVEQLKQCDLGYFMFKRQQGIGTICLCLQYQIPIVLDRDNPFLLDLQQNNVPFLFADTVKREQIQQVRQVLSSLDLSKVAFFPPNYRQAWVECLATLQ